MGLGFIVVWLASKCIPIFDKLMLNLTLGWFFGCVAYFSSPGTKQASPVLKRTHFQNEITGKRIRKTKRFRTIPLEERSPTDVVNYRKIMKAGLKADERGSAEKKRG